MKAIRDLKVIRLNDRNKLLAGAAAAALAAGVGGLLIGRSTTSHVQSATGAAEAPAGDGKERTGPEGFIPISPANAVAAGIRSETAAAGSLGSEILAQGTATAPPAGKSSLTARADGAVTSIFRRLGDPVAAGQTVALLESREAGTIMAERASAAARAQAATAALNRERRLFAAKITARQDLEAAVAAAAQAQAELRRTQAAVTAAGVTGDGRHLAVRSLINGRITKMSAELGAFVSAGAELFEVANPRSVQIEVAVPWTDAQRVRPGDPAVIELGGGQVSQAVVRSSTASLDPESRAATLVLAPSAIPAGLTQGQAFRVRIMPRGAPASGRIVLPEEALQSHEGRDIVFVQVRNGFQATPVKIGQRSAGRVEIVEGLEAGAVVATTNAFLLKAELGKGAGEEE